MITGLPGATTMKPGSASLPFFGIVPAIVDEEGNELEGECDQGYLVSVAGLYLLPHLNCLLLLYNAWGCLMLVLCNLSVDVYSLLRFFIHEKLSRFFGAAERGTRGQIAVGPQGQRGLTK